MKIPDYEFYHKIKGNLVDRIEALKDEDLKSAAKSHLLRSENNANSAINHMLTQIIDQVYFINEVLNSQDVAK